jgi:hypothetical protein
MLWVGLRDGRGPVPRVDGGLVVPTVVLEVSEGERELWKLPPVHRFAPPSSDGRAVLTPSSYAPPLE